MMPLLVLLLNKEITMTELAMDIYWTNNHTDYLEAVQMATAIEEGDLAFTPREILLAACEIHDIELTLSEAKSLLRIIGGCIDHGYADFYFYHNQVQYHFYMGEVS